MVRPTLVRWILAAQEWHRKAFAGSRPAIKFLKIQATVFADCRSLLAGALAHVQANDVAFCYFGTVFVALSGGGSAASAIAFCAAHCVRCRGRDERV